jgi:hypothetical protein
MCVVIVANRAKARVGSTLAAMIVVVVDHFWRASIILIANVGDWLLVIAAAKTLPEPRTTAATEAASNGFDGVPESTKENGKKDGNHSQIRHERGYLLVANESKLVLGIGRCGGSVGLQ